MKFRRKNVTRDFLFQFTSFHLPSFCIWDDYIKCHCYTLLVMNVCPLFNQNDHNNGWKDDNDYDYYVYWLWLLFFSCSSFVFFFLFLYEHKYLMVHFFFCYLLEKIIEKQQKIEVNDKVSHLFFFFSVLNWRQ